MHYIINKISINSLPIEILLEILKYLINYTSYKYVSSLKILCKLWNILIQHSIRNNLSKNVIKNLQLEIILSKFPIKSVKFNEDINIYFGTYNNTFSTKDEYHFTLSSSQNLIRDLNYVQIWFKHKIPVNKNHFDIQEYKFDKEFNKYWVTSIKKSDQINIVNFKLNLKLRELLNGERLMLEKDEKSKNYKFYARINFNKLMWLIDHNNT